MRCICYPQQTLFLNTLNKLWVFSKFPTKRYMLNTTSLKPWFKARNLTAEGAEGRRETKPCVLRVLYGDFKPLKNRDDRRDVYFSSPKVRSSIPCGIYTIVSSHSTHHSHLRRSISPAPPEGHFLLANFSQKFEQKLTSDPEGSFYSIFCEKIVFSTLEKNSETRADL